MMNHVKLRVYKETEEGVFACLQLSALPNMTVQDLMFLVRGIASRFDVVDYGGEVYEMGTNWLEPMNPAEARKAIRRFKQNLEAGGE